MCSTFPDPFPLPSPPTLLSHGRSAGDMEVSNEDYKDGGVNVDACFADWKLVARFATIVLYFRHVVIIVANTHHQRSR